MNQQEIAKGIERDGLQPGLKPRHIQMIALGGVIGAGLFVGASVVVKNAGPAAIISFLITGILIVLVMRMLGELASSMPATGSFYEYARQACNENVVLSKIAGFTTGWSYWYFWCMVVTFETLAAAKLVHYWYPDLPGWMISVVFLALMTLTNLYSVKSFGEFEFWFASIKVAAICVFLLFGTLYMLGMWPSHAFSGLNIMLSNGGFAPNGWGPVLAGAVAATGFYCGAELCTIAAAETADPVKSVAKATSSVISRVLLFYVGSIFFVVCIVPWNSEAISFPYVSALTIMKVPYAPDIMNAVILVAVLSCLNSGIYATSRMLFALTRHGDAPKFVAKLSKNGVPRNAVLLSTVIAWLATVASIMNDDIMTFLVESYGTAAIFVYVCIAFSQIKLRNRMEREDPSKIRVKMWGFPYLSYVTIAGMLIIMLSMAFIPSQQMAFWFGMAAIGTIVICGALRVFFGQQETVRINIDEVEAKTNH
ncbi:MAG: gabP [Firmicutes bacterium]|nr:gabP [Bacillota bacterium]